MEPSPISDDRTQAARLESAAEEQRRVAWKADRIADADASIAAGYYATSAEVKAWIDSIGTDRPLPAPYPRHPRPL